MINIAVCEAKVMACPKKKRGTRDKSLDLYYKSYGIHGKTCSILGKRKRVVTK